MKKLLQFIFLRTVHKSIKAVDVNTKEIQTPVSYQIFGVPVKVEYISN